ncbi:MAG: hypothetical protein AAB470_01670 [Patescibacteria group bacterium]
MPFTRTTALRLVKISAGILAVFLIVAYATWRSLNYARGPSITIDEPKNGATISASTTIIKGKVERVNSITLNDKPIFVDEQGNFSETLIVFPGTNILTLKAHDQFNRTVEKQLRIQK